MLGHIMSNLTAIHKRILQRLASLFLTKSKFLYELSIIVLKLKKLWYISLPLQQDCLIVSNVVKAIDCYRPDFYTY